MTLATTAERAGFQRLGWPSAREQSLLKVLTGPAEAAHSAWIEWRRQGDLASMGTAAARLVPLVVHRLRELGVHDEELPKLAGVLRHTWAANQLRLRAALEAIAALRAADIRVCALKGLPLLVDYFHGDLWARPMFDVDVMVPAASVRLASGILESHGWASVFTARDRGFWPGMIRSQHALAFRRGAANVDLHWHVFHQDLSPFFDELAIRHAEPLAGPGLPQGLLALSATDQLVHVCLHGLQHDAGALRSWTFDALRILEHPDKVVDWDRLVSIAIRRRFVVALEDALAFLSTVTPAVPSGVLAALATEPVYPIELVEYRALTRAWGHMQPEDRAALQRMRRIRESSPWVSGELLAVLAAPLRTLSPE